MRARLGTPLLVQNHSTFFDNPYWLRERLHHRLYDRLGRLVLRAADMYRTVNAHQRRAFIAAGGEKRRTVMLPLGTITEAFAAPIPSERVEALRQQLAIPATAPLIAWVGYGTPSKRLPLLLQVFARLRDQLPDVRLLLVGDLRRSPDDLERLMRRMGIRDVVHTPGVIPHHELPTYYALADAYVLTSAYEGAPRVLFEAGAVGVPVVAMRVPGVEEVIVDGVNGYIAPDRDIDGMTGRLLTILRDPILAAQMSAAARRLALECYDAERYADRWVSVWQMTIRIGRKSAVRRAQALT